MDRFDRIYRLHSLLSNRRTPIPLTQIMEHLECSKATANRCIESLRDYLGAPLEYHREYNGYGYNQHATGNPYQLPGLWFSAEELYGLLICQQILQNISPGLLTEQIQALQNRIDRMLRKDNIAPMSISEKIRIFSIGRRMKDDSRFKRIAYALFNNQRLSIRYSARGQNGQSSERIISGQRLLYYRDNWYLLAHCHSREALRIFAIDNVNSTRMLEQEALQVDDESLQEFLHSSYGIFSGAATHIAMLEFNSDRARWVADEHWHDRQQGEWQANGHYRLSVPFNDPRELIMDILKYGADVKVIEPLFLQEAVKQQIDAMHNMYKEK